MPCLCLECFEVYGDEAMFKTKYDYDTEMYCPKKSCEGSVIEVDELLLLSIKTLNQKGYITKFCCSGHVHDSYPQPYIAFEDDIDLPFENFVEYSNNFALLWPKYIPSFIRIEEKDNTQYVVDQQKAQKIDKSMIVQTNNKKFNK